MNRADIAKALAACEALIPELRAALKADAKAEFDEQKCVPTWRMPGVTVSASMTHDSVQIEDEAALLKWVQYAYPTEVYTETVTRIRSSWLAAFLAKVTAAGDPPRDSDQTIVPGLRFVPGGEFKTVSVTATNDTKAMYRQVARDILAGRRPLALPSSVDPQESSVADPDGA